jgi:eukaryotic-like serine/threonine-protein kinase
VTQQTDRLSAALAERYRLDRELGAGGMATVYLAHDLKHDRDVAIKVLHPDLGAALGGERFLTEIRTTARLQHPHILPLLDSGEADGLLYYVMPLVTGETLRARLERERQLPIADAVRIAREVASALDYAHRQNVIHRARRGLRYRARRAKRRWPTYDANRSESRHPAVHVARAGDG